MKKIGTAMLLFAALSAVPARAQSGADDSTITPAEPRWGTQDFSRLRIDAWGFEPAEDGMIFEVTSPGSNLRYCASSTSGYPRAYLEAGVHLPSGAVIDRVTTSGCDDGIERLQTTLYYTADPGGASVVLDHFTSLPGAGCFYGGTNVQPIEHTVDNTLNSYALEIDLPIGNSGVSLRSVAITYHLQVSPPPGSATFNDVPTSHLFFQYIEALAASGITAGCGGANYCPDAPLTRGQMAVFLAKALGLHWPF